MDWVLNQTMTQTALDNWCSEVKGGLYNLKNLITNAGAALNDTGGVSPLVIDDPIQGYLAPCALVPRPILLLSPASPLLLLSP